MNDVVKLGKGHIEGDRIVTSSSLITAQTKNGWMQMVGLDEDIA